MLFVAHVSEVKIPQSEKAQSWHIQGQLRQPESIAKQPLGCLLKAAANHLELG